MYARSTTIRGDPRSVDAAVAVVRDAMPGVRAMAGCVGLSMLADRETGTCVVTTSWRDRATVRSSAEAVQPLRAQLVRLLGAADERDGPSPPGWEAPGWEVHEWEVSAMHRRHEAHHGACARVTWLRGDPDGMDRAIAGVRSRVVPRLGELAGFCSVSLLTSAAEGMAVGAVTYDSRADVLESRDQARALRDEFAPALGLAVTDVREFDLVLAHLRVPETA